MNKSGENNNNNKPYAQRTKMNRMNREIQQSNTRDKINWEKEKAIFMLLHEREISSIRHIHLIFSDEIDKNKEQERTTQTDCESRFVCVCVCLREQQMCAWYFYEWKIPPNDTLQIVFLTAYDKRIFENSIKWLSLALILTVNDPRRVSMLVFFHFFLFAALFLSFALLTVLSCRFQFSVDEMASKKMHIEYWNLICAKQFMYTTQIQENKLATKKIWFSLNSFFLHLQNCSSSANEWKKWIFVDVAWCAVLLCSIRCFPFCSKISFRYFIIIDRCHIWLRGSKSHRLWQWRKRKKKTKQICVGFCQKL